MRELLGKVLWWRKPASPTCADIMVVLQAYLDGEVDAETASSVAQHLDACGGCEHEAAAYQDVIERLKRADGRTVDPGVLASLNQFGRSLLDNEGPIPS